MKDELTWQERREYAKYLYTKDGKSIADVSLEVNVTEAAVRSWIADGAWDSIKRSHLISREKLLDDYYSVLEAMQEKLRDDPSPKNIDNIVKYTAAIKNLEEEITLSQIIEVAEMFICWMRRRDLDLAKKVIVQLDVFIKQRAA